MPIALAVTNGGGYPQNPAHRYMETGSVHNNVLLVWIFRLHSAGYGDSVACGSSLKHRYLASTEGDDGGRWLDWSIALKH